ncbi:hypothetical protein BS47DRAFT_1374626 [Hydnum rufescens UP504]|uniref:glutamine--tRNA ligase n=1 Tax=Hydnum rufescens UP504 TaxID=1448309 RepID=A0A9P6DZN2_9AGAM|nr:hypothetical protein BS47DRAFT_1374626 [Hydnum rufescens UP504]
MRLAPPTGPYPVGLSTFSHAVPSKTYGRSKVQSGEHALVMEEILYNVHYPCRMEPGRSTGFVPWLVRPLADTLVGFAKFTGIQAWVLWPLAYLYAQFLKLPFFPDAPLLDPVEALAAPGEPKDKHPKWPLVIFSHGLAGGRAMYSHFCAELASEGYIVLAVEHRDGTGPSVRIRSNGTFRTLHYLRVGDIVWGENIPDHPLPLRSEQLVFRSAEVHETFRTFSHLIRGISKDLVCETGGPAYDFSQWVDKVDINRLILAGHSFGASTTFTIIRNPPPSSYAPLPISHALLLDPWLDPVPSTPVKPSHKPQLAIINSEVATLMKDHFRRLRDTVVDWNEDEKNTPATLMTIVRARHGDFSDLSVLFPIRVRRGIKLAKVIRTLSLAFLRDTLYEELDKVPRRDSQVIEGKRSRRLTGKFAEMAPKFDPAAAGVAPLIATFKSLGLSESKAVEAARSPKNAAALKALIDQADLTTRNLDDKRASLIASLSISAAKLQDEAKLYAAGAIVDGRLKSAEQVSAAIKYLESHPPPVNDTQFGDACGVGIELTPGEVYAVFQSLLSVQPVEGWSALPNVINAAKAATKLRWASPLDVKNAADRVFTEKFGPRDTSKTKAKETKKASPAPAKSGDQPEVAEPAPERSVFEEGFLARLHKPGENPQIKPELRDRHLTTTGGKVFTRFPPEPNGFLHIGHSKAIFVDFGYAAHLNGHCYLRYDDTNPEAEEARYFESILETIRWLGFEPYRITYSSDYFSELYDLAVELIKRDKAYICHCTGEEINAHRGGETHAERTACAHRSRPISESLIEFQAMKDGQYHPGEAILRMKQDLADGNPQMWDLIAYRVLDAPHHRTGTKWRIYPTYDFTHCLVDSFENISHSLCTTEFITARQSYEWLCDALEVYKPRQSEFGRLNLQGTVTSKRKIQKLVKDKYVLDWDDPRLYTLVALRRRGVPPEAILAFVGSLGVSTATTNIQVPRFEQVVRQYLENSAPRLLMVLKPLKVVLENVPEDYVVMHLANRSVPFSRTLYIDADDFRIQDSKDYFRLAPGKTVGLFQGPHSITCISYKTDPSTGEVIELSCRLEDGSSGPVPPKPKAFIQWVAEHAPSGSPVRVDETRIFHPLFKSDNPAALDNFLSDVNADSPPNHFWCLRGALRDARSRTERALKEEENGEIPASREDVKDDTPRPSAEQLIGNECVRFQGLRVAYFSLDKDTKLGCLGDAKASPGPSPGDKIILNRIVTLKEDASKKTA